MGIPAFYRWLLERYPKSVVECIEETPAIVNGITVPIDTSTPNPNGIEFDNLYLDMNGIIHPCFHPEGLPAPETYDQVFQAVFKYIDRIFSIVRPRKLLFMAIDGVAPRAKMNQQRARRFKAAKDAADEASNTGRVRGNDEAEREDLSTEKLDSNIITPGTKFMDLLSSALQYYVRLKMNADSGWQGIKVILSDATVPGEGEHKIMSYIRLQRNLPGFDPNTRHCLYGLDADLIMLALATHEVHFSILREDVYKDKSKDRGQNSRNYKHRQQAGKHSKKGEGCGNELENLISEQTFQFLRVWVLRDYLAFELQIPNPTVKLDLERLIDDFVFMCLFVGNDFLPHVPSLEISEGAIDLLMNVYKKEFVNMGGYLTDSCQVNLERVGHFIQAIGSYENDVFRKRIQAQKDWEIRSQRFTANLAVKENQKKNKHVHSETLSAVDKVKLGQEGWKERYYAEKFEIPAAEDRVRIQKDAVLKYVEGICWVMHYYYQGVCSWQWFYPYHYAPFASDFHDLDRLEIHFTIGKPFKPFDQLMGVLPAARKLMTDPLSPILDFYPSDFELDINGKRHAWQAVCKLPFIEESRLLSEIANVEDTLTVEEKQRNSLGLDMLFVYMSYPLAAKILSFCARNKDNPKLAKAKVKRKIHPKFSHGMNGFIYISDKPVCPIEIYSPVKDMDMIAENKVISVFYKVPCFHPHIPRPPKGVIMPSKAISKNQVQPQPILWHERTAVTQNRHFRRPMPRNSVSRDHLARRAHQLVVENCLLKQQVNGVGSNDSHNGSEKQQLNGDGSNDSLSGSKKKRLTKSERKRRKREREMITQQVNGDVSNDGHNGSEKQQVNGDGSNDRHNGSENQQVNGDGSNDTLSGSKNQEVNGAGSNDTLSGSKNQEVNGAGSNDTLSGSKKRRHSGAEIEPRKKERQMTQQVNGDGSNDSHNGSEKQQVNGDGSNDGLSGSEKQEENGDGINESLGGSKKKKLTKSERKQRKREREMMTQQVNGDGSNDGHNGSEKQQVNGDGSNDTLSGSKNQEVNGAGSNDTLSGSKNQEVNGAGSNDTLSGSKKRRHSGAEIEPRKKGRQMMTQQVNGDGSNDSHNGSEKQQGSNDGLSGSEKQEENGDGINDSLGGSKKKKLTKSERKQRKREREMMTQQVNGDGNNDGHNGSEKQQVNGDGSNDTLSGSKNQEVNGAGSNDTLSGSKKRRHSGAETEPRKKERQMMTQQVNGDGSNDSHNGSEKQQVNGDGSNDGLSGSEKQEVNDGINDSLGGSKKKLTKSERKRRKREREMMTQQVNGDGSNDRHNGSEKQQVNGDGSNDTLSGSKNQEVNGVSNDSHNGTEKQQVN